jgi:hypothetical protein
MRYLWFAFALTALLITEVSAGEPQYVVVDDPYIELRTGPGRGFPITQVVERGAEVGILKQRTDWFKVVTQTGREGWVNRSQMALTLQPTGEPLELPATTLAEYLEHRWEVGFLAGDFGGATTYNLYGSRRLSKHLSAELSAAQILGNVSDGWAGSAHIVHTFTPERRVSPFFSLGTGIIRVEPKATLAQTEDRTDQVGIVGVGLKAYVTRHFMFRAEYKSYVVFSSRNNNEDVDEWKAGFAVFF